jgi:hypothetical protein
MKLPTIYASTLLSKALTISYSVGNVDQDLQGCTLFFTAKVSLFGQNTTDTETNTLKKTVVVPIGVPTIKYAITFVQNDFGLAGTFWYDVQIKPAGSDKFTLGQPGKLIVEETVTKRNS